MVSMKLRLNTPFALAAGAVAIVAVGGFGFLSMRGGGDQQGYAFETASVETGDVARIVSASGQVKPLNQVEVGSEVSGKVVELLADNNSLVKKDQVLARIDPETFRSAVEQARARVLQAQAAVANAGAAIDRSKVNLDVAERDWNRKKRLFAEQAIAEAAWEQADRDYKYAKLEVKNNEVSLQSARAGLEQARASMQEADLRLERTKIRSPIDGVVLNRAVEVGQTVQSSMNVARFFTIAQDLSQIEIEAAVVESDIGGVTEGDPASFTVDAFPGERFQGAVTEVRKLGAEQSNVVTYTVVVSATNPQGKLLPGMTANVEITADRANGVLRIANDALKFNPPRELRPEEEEAEGGPPGMGGGPPGMGGGPPGSGGGPPGAGGGGRGGRGMGGPTAEWLKEMGVDQARIDKISADMGEEFQKLRASMPQPGGGGGGGSPFGGGGMGPPAAFGQSAAMSEMRNRIQAMQDSVLRRHLNQGEMDEFQKRRSARQAQKREDVWVVNDKGELERKPVMIGISDSEFAQVVSGAAEGDVFVTRATAGSAARDRAQGAAR
jgi:HlyD family secretion protein